MDKNCISTVNHIRFDPTEPKSADIEIEDIAHALSYITRANGHFNTFFSVARHSINCALEAIEREYTPRVALLCLLHDAAEAYIGDMTRPLKLRIPEFSVIEKKYQKIIFDKFIADDLSDDELRMAREIDDAMLYHEFLTFNGEELFDKAPVIHIDVRLGIRPIDATKAQFLRLFEVLREKLGKEA